MNAISPEIQRKIQHWKDRLAGLKRDTALLNFVEGKGKTVKLLLPASQVFQVLVSEEPRLPMSTVKTDPVAPEHLPILKKLRNGANQIQREKGVNSLFVTIGTLTWNLKGETKNSAVSPILLIPVELQKTRRREEFTLVAIDEDIILNPVLVQKLDADHGISLRPIPSGQTLTCDAVLDQVRQDVAEFSAWKIEPVAHLALFERPKAAMLNDLEQYAEKIARHPILQGLANDLSGYQRQHHNIPDARHLDQQHPRSLFQVLDADSSQQVVIEAAKSGLNFITQGPPGTGKSQTIANIIVELIAKRMRVLLVAEKPGALEVVARRLRDCGLEDLCLTLYEKETASKKGFSRSLKATADKLEDYSETRLSDSFLDQLKDVRQTLNSYPEKLHHIWEPIEKSSFDLYSELLKLERINLPPLKAAIRNINQWSASHLRDVKRQLELLEGFDSFFRGGRTTLWVSSRRSGSSLQDRVALQEEITTLRRGIESTKAIALRIQELLSLQVPTSLSESKSLSASVAYVTGVPSLLPSEWENVTVTNLKRSFSRFEEIYSDFYKLRQLLGKKYARDPFTEALAEPLQQFYQKYRNILRLINKNYWRAHKAIFACRKEQSRLAFWRSFLFGYRELIADLQRSDESHRLYETLNSPTHAAFAPFFDKGKPNLNAIETALNWIEELQNYPLPSDRVATLLSSSELSIELVSLENSLAAAQQEIETGFVFLNACFPDVTRSLLGSNQPLDWTSFSIIEAFLDRAEDELNTFADWTRYQKCLATLKAMGVEAFLSSLKISEIAPESWFSVLQKAVYQGWLDYIYDHFSELKDFSATVHERRIQEFSKCDRDQYSVAKERLQKLHADQWKIWSEQPGSQEKIMLLNTESKKQKQHRSVRQFIKEAGDLVSALKPCWMMSPLSVSEYIDPQTPQFDVVIFDEASQIRTEEAVSSIMRAKQVIVVGDDKQLPPTFSFTKFDADEDEDSNGEGDYESFLVECGKFMRSFTLRWHYRSQDESLISFSNEHFYNSKLITFPNPIKDENRGVHFHYVADGVYDRGSRKPVNQREAEEVAKLVLRQVQSSQQSVGIIAFSKNQAEAIQKELDRLSENNLDLAELQEDADKFFLRHLESVQGEERDVIILSFCYGRDKEGKVWQNFGPLNKIGGERRLNVAITRARQKLILVASIHGSELQPEGNSLVVKQLQDYLNYAERNHAQTEELADLPELPADAGVVEDIYYALQQAGHRVCPSVGRSKFPIDLAILNDQRPSEFLLGIEVDGRTYEAYNTARDRDRIRRKVLEEDLNWKIYRIWSKEWFHNRDTQLNELLRLLRILKNQQS